MTKEYMRNRMEQNGYKVVACAGYRNGIGCITGYMAKKGYTNYQGDSITALYRSIFG